MKRCSYVNLDNPRYVAYHDHEWGRPLHDDRALFELLTLECFQAGLSWECVLNKRGAFVRAYEGLDPAQVAAFDERKVAALLEDPGIIRNRLKVRASVSNAQAFLRIQEEFGSFDAYLWGHVGGRALGIECRAETSSELSDAISADLRRRGMKFVGTTVVYSYLQAAGVVNAHEPDCALFEQDLLDVPGCTLRAARDGDVPALLAMNEADVWALSPMDEGAMAQALARSRFTWTVEEGGRAVAFLVAYVEGADYGSENYRWFAARHERFLYIDRIVVDRSARGRGLARALYGAVADYARNRKIPVVAAEVKVEPACNEPSLRLHGAAGFREVARRRLRDGAQVVSMQELALDGPGRRR